MMVRYWKKYTGFPIRKHGAPPTTVEPSGKVYDRAKERARGMEQFMDPYDFPYWGDNPGYTGDTIDAEVVEPSEPRRVDPKPMKIQLDSYEEE